MIIGPLELLWTKFSNESATRSIAQELNSVRKSGLIRLVDMVFVNKDMNGEVHSKEVSDLAEAQKAEYGLVLQGLLGVRAANQTPGNVDKILAAMSTTPGKFGVTNEQVQQWATDLPLGGSGMLMLFEHVWAVRLKEAMLNAGGQVLIQARISPEAMTMSGTTIEEAVAAAKKIQAEAETVAAAKMADVDAKQIEVQRRLDDADAKAAMIVAAAVVAAESKQAEAQRHLDEADAKAASVVAALTAEAEAKKAEAQRVLDEASVQAAAKIEEALKVADATVSASARTAADKVRQADEYLKKAKEG